MTQNRIRIYGELFATLVVVAITLIATFEVAQRITSLDSEVATAIITASVGGVFSIWIVQKQKTVELTQTINLRLFEQKVEKYEIFVGFLYDLLLSKRTGKLTDQEFNEQYATVTKQVSLWASTEVIRKYAQFRKEMATRGQKTSEEGETKPRNQLLFDFEEIILSLRNDLGHDTSGIMKDDILRLVVNDIDDHL